MPAPAAPDAHPQAPEVRGRAVLEIGRAVASTLDPDELLGIVMARLAALLDAERSTLFLVDRQTGELRSRVALGEGMTEIRLPPGRGLAGHVAQTGSVVNVPDAYADPRFNPEVDRFTGFRTASVLTAPLTGRDGSVIGVAQVLNRRGGGAFGPDDEGVLASVGGLVGMALENASLFAAAQARNAELERTQQRLRRKIAEMDLLCEIEREISRADALDPMLAAILDRAMATVGARAGAVLLLDEGSGELRVRRSPGAPLELRALGPVHPAGVLAQALESGGPASGAAGSLLALAGVAAPRVLCVALPGAAPGAAPVGALELADEPGEPFTPDEGTLATLVAAQLARAVSLARSRAEAERAGRLAALGQMLGGIVHDLRSPMTVIGGYAELMVREADTMAREQYARRIQSQFEHVNALTREVLAFVRGERRLLVRRVPLGAFWEELRPALARELEPRRAELTIEHVSPDAARLDEAKIRRLVTNLARNAAQALQPGGRFTVRCEADGDALLLTLSDTGPGIPATVAARLFEAFRTAGKPGGTGLGLAIAKEAAEAHGGTIEHVPGPGTTFVVRLPAAVAT